MSELAFRPLARDDFVLLGSWLDQPHVRTWWRESGDPASVEAAYGPSVDGSDPTEVFVVELDGSPLGLLQRYRVDDHPQWRAALAPAAVPEPAAGIDYLIGVPGRTGHGLGTRLVAAGVEDLWRRYPDVCAVVVDVAQDNRPSWRVLERNGFVRHWSGNLVSGDPSDHEPIHLYVRSRRPDDAVDAICGAATGNFERKDGG